MTIVIINPPLVTEAADPLGSGIPYLPVLLAQLAGKLRGEFPVTVLDAFGAAPEQAARRGRFLLQGLDWAAAERQLPVGVRAAVFYLGTVAATGVLKDWVARFKAVAPETPAIVIENSQGVIGCSLELLADELLAAGADYLVLGESEERVPELLRRLAAASPPRLEGLDGLIRRGPGGAKQVAPATRVIEDLDALPAPAWDLFPLAGYWRIGYAHGPMSGPYLSLLSSRGCPYRCGFCSVPVMNRGAWRARSAAGVVEEMARGAAAFGVRDFQWEDPNPTASERRMLEIAAAIRERRLDVRWKLVSGIKLETLGPEALDALRAAGCDYLSFSPESGSPRVLAAMNKKFDHAHGLAMTRRLRRLGIRSQACFVLGHPGEAAEDVRLTERYIRELVRAGLDEIALFILTPMPGTRTYGELGGYAEVSELTFAPVWRADYPALARTRDRIYRRFLFWKLRYQPLRLAAYAWELLTRRFTVKATMNIYRVWKLQGMLRRAQAAE